ncbi:hypothetical protein K5V21_07765 [Clostridium sardiniense]|uniref:Uncharacterized protein n=1 Tax=Clostridium sardiniense TaxID=29369 RepID=A0ABS7KXH6_CLOSR|nr:hypothetical protein [Clostridium sardiniense]MBY0755352.1 hypothetical protein [Clostridium sardiniense]MDQ0459798.1 hypothetical protein [Clostridium sardiniense]
MVKNIDSSNIEIGRRLKTLRVLKLIILISIMILILYGFIYSNGWFF